jgi:hypothetical protein
MYHLHFGKFGFCHPVRHDGESATGLHGAILPPTKGYAPRTRDYRARFLYAIG